MSPNHLQPPHPPPFRAADLDTDTRPFILVPLYIYPAPAAWAPLYTAAEAHPDLDFQVIVNPANGPGAGLLPDANYVDALVRLTALPNVKVIGYVHCSYGKRLAEDIVADVEAYGRWEGEMSARGEAGKAIVVDGIFIDETPSSTEFVKYMALLANAAKTILNRNVLIPTDLGGIAEESTTAENGKGQVEEGKADDTTTTTTTVAEVAPEVSAAAEKPPPPTATAEDDDTRTTPAAGALTPASQSSAVVIYNPGVVVDPIFYQAADYVVAFENGARAWTLPVVSTGFRRLPRPLAARSVAVAHSASGGAVEVGQTSRRVAEAGCRGVFVTSRGGYTEWCPAWGEFVEEVARRTMV